MKDLKSPACIRYSYQQATPHQPANKNLNVLTKFVSLVRKIFMGSIHSQQKMPQSTESQALPVKKISPTFHKPSPLPKRI